ncbi:MAG: HTH domain-containing protein [Leptospiraceae bacterium]|nr:HTH domain-containing protein [Leptospiraceae bacterium]
MPKAIKISPDLELFINKLGLFYQTMGLPHISGRILGLLLILDKPFSPEDITKLLKVSRSSISTNIKLLKMYGFLEEERIPGIRRKYFRISKNAWENSLKVKIGTYPPFQEILKEGIAGMKKINKTPVLIEELMEYTNMEKKLYENFLKDWIKKNKKK